MTHLDAMEVAVGVVEKRTHVNAELHGQFKDLEGKVYDAGRYQFSFPIELKPVDSASASFSLEDVTIGIGFHWQRNERQTFRGALRVMERDGLLTAINRVSLEDYVASVISSEMSATCPIELLKAHAVISRSWLWYPRTDPDSLGRGNVSIRQDDELTRWYGREAHEDFDVCADDHCQRYQGITKAFSSAAEKAVRSTGGEMLVYRGRVCDTRFYKCCGGLTESYATAWDARDVPYLVPVYDGPGGVTFGSVESWILNSPPAYCNTQDVSVLSQILPNFDQETRDFYRWRVEYDREELGEIVNSRLGSNLGSIENLVPLARGRSGRIYKLQIVGKQGTITIGKELEIRRALSRSHLYSSAFVMQQEGDRIVLRGAGWGHGVGLCQIGAAVMANQGMGYKAILQHYYPGTSVTIQRVVS